MQQQLQEAQHLKAELERVTAAAAAREAQGSASLREATAQMNEAAAQMSAAQEVAQIAREKEAEAAVAMLQRFMFDLPFAMHPWLWLVGPVAGAVLVGGLGVGYSRKAVVQPPLEVLKNL